MSNQKGFSIVEVLLLIVALSIIGFGSYYVWNTQRDNKLETSSSQKNEEASAVTTTSESTINEATKNETIKTPVNAEAATPLVEDPSKSWPTDVLSPELHKITYSTPPTLDKNERRGQQICFS